MTSSSPLAIPDPVRKANQNIGYRRRQLMPHIMAHRTGLDVAASLTELTDHWLCTLWDRVLPPSYCERVTLYATGGYGRRELAYHSDIDVLIAVDDPDVTEEADFHLAIERLMAWSRDADLRLSHAVRTAPQALRALDDDLRNAIALLDLRRLAGPEPTDHAFLRAGVIDHLRGDDGGRTFVATLVDGLRRRIARHGKTVYLLEPDVKNGEGGLRDLNCLNWAARVRWNLDIRSETDDTVGWSDEHRTDYGARLDSLLSLRNRLHLLRGRKHDRLNFREQEALALLADTDPPQHPEAAEETARQVLSSAEAPADDQQRRTDVYPRLESMMGEYYRRARAIATTSERLLRYWATDDNNSTRRQGPFQICGARLHLVDPATLDDHAVFRALQIAAKHDLLLDPRLEARIEARVARWPVGDDAPDSLARHLTDLLVDPDQPERTSQRLVDLGILCRLVPEFEPLICHVQHDLYHVYTTDVHSRKCLEAARALRSTAPEDHARPTFCQIAADIDDPTPFLLACLFHDIGKNRGGDHSQRGARLVESIAPRLGLDAHQTERLAFLVEHHLDLSTTSKRRDLSDPEIIAGLAETIGSVECLRQLTALTYCDMATVGPDVLNDWNASLLAECFHRIRAAIDFGPHRPHTPPSAADIDDLRSQLIDALDDDCQSDSTQIGAFIDDLPADQLRNIELDTMIRRCATYCGALDSDDGFAIRTHTLPDRSVTEVIISGPDHPGTLARIAGAIASVGLNIMTADIITTDSGRMLDTFLVAHFNPRAVPPSPPRPVDSPRRLDRLHRRISEVLTETVDIDQILEQRRNEQRLAPRPVPAVDTDVRHQPDASSRHTVLEVRAPDCMGLLYAIARLLHDCRVSTRLSRIDSLGNKAIDTFYVEEFDGSPLTSSRVQDVTDTLRTGLNNASGCRNAP